MGLNTKHKRVWEPHWLQAFESPNLQWSRVDSAMCLATTSLRSPRKISLLMTVIELRKPPVVFNYPSLSKHIGLISQHNAWYRWSQTTDTFITLSSLPPSVYARMHESEAWEAAPQVCLHNYIEIVLFAFSKGKTFLWLWGLLNDVAWCSYSGCGTITTVHSSATHL